MVRSENAKRDEGMHGPSASRTAGRKGEVQSGLVQRAK